MAARSGVARGWVALVLVLVTALITALASAQSKTWETTGTSTTSVPEAIPRHRIERRAFEKRGRFVVRTGFSWLSRGDFYTNPGIGLDVAWYPEETVGIDLLSATAFFSELTSTAKLLRETTGLLPDSQKPILRVGSGVRLAFAYGKLLLEDLDVVVHMDASAVAHLGLLITSSDPNPGGDLGLALQAAAAEHFVIWLEASWLLSYERRTSSNLASGPMATFGVGFLL